MKKLLLTALFATVSIAFVNAQNYYVSIQNCTETSQEVEIEILDDVLNCHLTGTVSITVPPVSFTFAQVMEVDPNLNEDDFIVWARATAECPGEAIAQYVLDNTDCVSLSNQMGNANCIGIYTIQEVPRGNIIANTCTNIFSSPPGVSLGFLDIQ